MCSLIEVTYLGTKYKEYILYESKNSIKIFSSNLDFIKELFDHSKEEAIQYIDWFLNEC